VNSALAIPLGALALSVFLTGAALYRGKPDIYQFPILIGGAMIVLALFMLADVVMRKRAGVVATVEAEPLPLASMWPAFAVMAGLSPAARAAGLLLHCLPRFPRAVDRLCPGRTLRPGAACPAGGLRFRLRGHALRRVRPRAEGPVAGRAFAMIPAGAHPEAVTPLAAMTRTAACGHKEETT
jgi:hypothetical protein